MIRKSWLIFLGLYTVGLLPMALVALALPGQLPLLWYAAYGCATLGALLWAVVDTVLALRRQGGWRWKWLGAAAGMALGAVLLSAGIQYGARRYLFEIFKIPSDSMAPTVVSGDRFFVSKLPGKARRGELVIFRGPRSVPYLKRVVGIPGDEVEFRSGDLYVNGAVVPYRRLEEPGVHPDGLPAGLDPYEETLGDHTYRVLRKRTGGEKPDFSARVPEGHLFVLGDNRDNSYDSRHFGPIPEDAVRGFARQIWWSHQPDTGAIRWTRIGRLLE